MDKYKSISDWIPVVGLCNYIQRNEYSCLENDNVEIKKQRATTS